MSHRQIRTFEQRKGRMEEFVDILDAHGRPTGESCAKSEAHRKGLLHPTVHIWLYTKKGEVLIQQRGRTKNGFPLLWDVSVAGHIISGETVLEAAVREVGEEIGLDISESDLIPIGVSKAVHRHSDTYIDAEFHHVFLCGLRVPLGALRRQASEVEALKLISLIRLAEESWGLAKAVTYVPHGPSYYKNIVTEIKKRL